MVFTKTINVGVIFLFVPTLTASQSVVTFAQTPGAVDVQVQAHILRENYAQRSKRPRSTNVRIHNKTLVVP